MKKLTTCLAASALLCMASSAFAEIKPGTFSLSPYLGGYLFDGAEHLKHKPLYGLRGGYNYTKNLGVEAVFDFVNSKGTRTPATNTTAYGYRLDALYHFLPDNKLVPYIAGGLGGKTLDRRTGQTNKTSAVADLGGGLKYFFADSVALRGDVRDILAFERFRNNVEYSVGLDFLFGGPQPAPAPVVVPAPAPAPAPAPIVEKPAPAPAPVPAPPADSDGDGVIDGLDKCPATPSGVAVNASGCPLDTDGDGVFDYLDKCPGTPKGVAVDSNGCPLDTDGDGVLDYLDKCPGTPKGITVDKSGCPLDTDGDGVYDYLDKCPDTPKTAAVDSKGCPERICIVLKVEFDFNKAVVKPQYNDELKKVSDFLKEYPDATAVIEGYTDNKGSDKYNQKLSEQRAENVKKYLTEKHGIAAARLSSKGYGESKPVADNNTDEGREKNRRVVANIDCGWKKKK